MYLLPAAVVSPYLEQFLKGGKVRDKGERYAPP